MLSSMKKIQLDQIQHQFLPEILKRDDVTKTMLARLKENNLNIYYTFPQNYKLNHSHKLNKKVTKK